MFYDDFRFIPNNERLLRDTVIGVRAEMRGAVSRDLPLDDAIVPVHLSVKICTIGKLFCARHTD